MLSKSELVKIDFDDESIEFILELETKYACKIEHLVKEYIICMKKEKPVAVYEGNGRGEAYKRAVSFTESVHKALPEVDQYAARLLGWVQCIPVTFRLQVS